MKDIIIVGGGVGGLALAASLRDSNHRVTVLERDDKPEHGGLGFLLMPNGLAALADLGLRDAAVARGTVVEERLDGVAGAGPLHRRRLEPHLCLARADLLAVLETGIAPGVFHTRSLVAGLQRDQQGALRGVILSDGEAVAADAVVAADGGRSIIRAQLFPDAQVGPGKLAEVIARVRAPAVAAELGARLCKLHDPRGGLMVGLAPAAPDEIYWYVQWDPSRGLPDGGDPADVARFVKEEVGGWPAPLPELVGATDFTEAVAVTSTDLDPLPTFAVGDVVFVGDAAHLLLPLSTQGASAALEDAVVLAESLRTHPMIGAAFAAYDARRRPDVERHLHHGRERLAMLQTPPRTPPSFDDGAIERDILRTRAFNHRWAMVPEDVLPLTAADHDFPLAAPIRDAITAYVSRGPLSYGPPEGLPGYRGVVADVMRGRRGVPCTAEGVLATDSAASAMYLTARWALAPGDEAIVFDPVDYLFVGSVEAAGGVVVRCPLDLATGRFDPERLASLVTPRTRMIGVCNPHNPLGHVLEPDEVDHLGRLAFDHGLWLMNDEVWADVVYEPATLTSVASLDPAVAARTVTVGGFSKSFGLAGLRIGYIASSEPSVRDGLFQASRAESTAYGAATLSQIAAQAAYEDGWDWFAHFLMHLQRVRDLAVDRLNAMAGVTCATPQGTFLLFPDVSSFGRSSEDLAAHVLEAGGVAVVPGSPKWFGNRAEGHVRIAYATSETIVNEGLNRLERALAVA